MVAIPTFTIGWLGNNSHPRRHEKRNSESDGYLPASNPFCEGGFELLGIALSQDEAEGMAQANRLLMWLNGILSHNPQSRKRELVA